jgi:hypothetical protein
METDTKREAMRIGGRKAAVACVWMLLLFEAMMFFIGSHGDLLHEGRNFIVSQTDPLATSVVVVAFVVVFLLGRVAGRQIIVAGKNHLLVALTQWAITMAVLVVYTLGFSRVLDIGSGDWGNFFLMLGLITGCVWLIAVRGIKRAGATRRGSGK